MAGAEQVVSGLAKHMSLEELQGRRVVIVANLKPANMRKVLSQAMVLAATAPDGSKVGTWWTQQSDEACLWRLSNGHVTHVPG